MISKAVIIDDQPRKGFYLAILIIIPAFLLLLPLFATGNDTIIDWALVWGMFSISETDTPTVTDFVTIAIEGSDTPTVTDSAWVPKK